MSDDVGASFVSEKEPENGDNQDLLKRWNVPIAAVQNVKSKDNSTSGSSKKKSREANTDPGCVSAALGCIVVIAIIAGVFVLVALLLGDYIFE